MVEEVSPAVLKRTQEILGSVIKKPPLVDKNLKRPPFRFLHDIITNVIKTSGFMKGLYTPEEMQSESIKDKESKIAFLQKAIDLLALVTNQPVNVKPSKIVAGHEAQKTNEFLQLLGSAVKSKLDSKEAVQAVHSKSGAINHVERRTSVDKRPSQKNASEKAHVRSTTKTLEPAKKPTQSSSSSKEPTKAKDKDAEKSRSLSKDRKPREKDKDKPKEKSHSKRDGSKSRESKKEKSSERSKKSKRSSENSENAPKTEETFQPNGYVDNDDDAVIEDVPLASPSHAADMNSQIMNGDVLGNDLGNNDDSSAINDIMNAMTNKSEDKIQRPPSEQKTRPPSARSKRTKLAAVHDVKTEVPSTPQLENGPTFDARIHDGTVSPISRPLSARPSSSRPAPPRIRIRHIVENDEQIIRPETAKVVEHVILDQTQPEEEDEDETFVVAEEHPDDVLEPTMLAPSGPQETPDEDKGSLVKQLLETKKDLEGGSQHPLKRVEVDKSQLAVTRARESSHKELEQLRNFIQNVSKTAYPLGRMLDYLQEDVDSMKIELRTWKEEHRQNMLALRKEKSVTESMLDPLRVQLDDLDQLVQDQLDANGALKSAILRNEERIQRMLAGIQWKS